MLELLNPEDVNAFIKLIAELVLLIFGTSVGTFTRELVFPKANTFKQNVGLSLISGFLSFGILLKYPSLSLEYIFLMTVSIGFFVPVFQDWFKGKKLFKILFRVLTKTADMASTTISEVHAELEKETE